jgi:DNA-binding NarL/FixJ family response regulator
MKLLLADDHTLFRDALHLYIQRAQPSATVSLACDFHEALKIMGEKPDQDLVLLDLRMPGMNGLEGFVRMRQDYPAVKVALMSGVAEPEDVKEAMTLGAAGYFPKTLSGKNLIRAIKTVLEGQVFLPHADGTDTIMPSYYQNYQGEPQALPMHMPMRDKKNSAIHFTAREQEVIAYLSKGSANKEIAEGLGLQVVTVKLHVRSICQKLGAKNRTQAALMVKDLIEKNRV